MGDDEKHGLIVAIVLIALLIISFFYSMSQKTDYPPDYEVPWEIEHIYLDP